MRVGEELSCCKYLSVIHLCSSWLATLAEKQSCSSHHPWILPVGFSQNEKRKSTLQRNRAFLCKWVFLSERGWQNARISVKLFQVFGSAACSHNLPQLTQLTPTPSHQPLGLSSSFVLAHKSLVKVIIMFLVYPRREAEGICGRSDWEHSHVVQCCCSFIPVMGKGLTAFWSAVYRKFVKCFAWGVLQSFALSGWLNLD